MQSIDSIETYVHGTSKYLVSWKEDIKCKNIEMINFDDVTKEEKKRIIQIGYKFLIIHRLWIWKNNDKIYVKDPHEAKYQFLINKQESSRWKHLNDSKAFIEYSNDIDDIKI